MTEAREPWSTANIFDLPCWYQHRIGSLDFGLANEWVFSGGHHGFPLPYHCRVVPLVVSERDRVNRARWTLAQVRVRSPRMDKPLDVLKVTAADDHAVVERVARRLAVRPPV